MWNISTMDGVPLETRGMGIESINPLNPTGNYMYHLL